MSAETLVLTAPQRKFLTELAFRASPPPNECWLVTTENGQTALVVQTIVGDYVYKATFAPATVSGLHGLGLIQYGRTHQALKYLVDEDDRAVTAMAMQVHITLAGKKAQEAARRQTKAGKPRHRA